MLALERTMASRSERQDAWGAQARAGGETPPPAPAPVPEPPAAEPEGLDWTERELRRQVRELLVEVEARENAQHEAEKRQRAEEEAAQRASSRSGTGRRRRTASTQSNEQPIPVVRRSSGAHSKSGSRRVHRKSGSARTRKSGSARTARPGATARRGGGGAWWLILLGVVAALAAGLVLLYR